MGSTISYFVNKNTDKKVSENKPEVTIEKTYDELLELELEKLDLSNVKTKFKSINEQLSSFDNDLDNNELFKESKQNIESCYINISKQCVSLLRSYTYKFNSDNNLIEQFRNICEYSDGTNFEELYEQFLALANKYDFNTNDVDKQITNMFVSVINVCSSVIEYAKGLIQTYNKNWKLLISDNENFQYVIEEIKNDEKYNGFDLETEVYQFIDIIDSVINESNAELSLINNIKISDTDDVNYALTKCNECFDYLYDLLDDENELKNSLNKFKTIKQKLLIFSNEDIFANEALNIINDCEYQYQNMINTLDYNNILINQYYQYVNDVKSGYESVALSINNHLTSIKQNVNYEIVNKQVQELLPKITNSIKIFNENFSSLNSVNLENNLTLLMNVLTYLRGLNYSDEWLEKYNNLNISECLVDFDNYVKIFDILESSYNELSQNYVKLISIDKNMEELFSDYSSLILTSYENNIKQYTDYINAVVIELEKMYNYVNEMISNINDERLISCLDNMLNCYYNIGIKSLEGKIGFKVYFDKYKSEYEKSSGNLNEIALLFQQCEEQYNNIVNSYNVFIVNYNNFITLSMTINEENKQAKELEQEKLDEIEYNKNVEELQPEIESKTDNLTSVYNFISEVEKTINFFNEDLNKLITDEFKSLDNDYVISTINMFYDYKSEFIQVMINISNTRTMLNVFYNSFTSINTMIENKEPLTNIKIELSNINTSVLLNITESITNSNAKIMEYYNNIINLIIIVYNSNESLKQKAIETFENELSTYNNIIQQFSSDITNKYINTFVPLNNEIIDKYNEVFDILTNEDSDFNKTLNYWNNIIEEFVQRNEQEQFKNIINKIDSNMDELETSTNAFKSWIETYNESVLTPVKALVSDFENSYAKINSNLSFNSINEAYQIAKNVYDKINELNNNFSQSSFDKLKLVFNNNYLNVKTSIDDFYNLIIAVNEAALLNKRNIIKFTNAGKILCVLFGKYYFGRYNEVIDKDRIKQFIYKALTVEDGYIYPLDVFETLCNFSPILPLIWPYGKTENEVKINTLIETNCEYDKTTNTINFSKIYTAIEETLLSYVQNELVDYITNATINSMNNVYDNEELISKENETLYINFLEVKCKQCADENEFIDICYDLFNVCKLDWKLLKFVSGKKAAENIIVIPNNYPKTNINAEINEAIIIILNRIFNWYGLLIDKNGKRIKYNENITNENIIHGGQCIYYNNDIYYENRMSVNKFDKYGFVLVNSLKTTDELSDISTYNKTEKYVLDVEEYKKYINPTRYFDIIFDEGTTDLDTLLKPLSITNFIGLDGGIMKTIENLINNIRNYLFGVNGKFALSINDNFLLNVSLDYINLTSSDGYKLYSIVYKYIMSNISNWKTVFPLTKVTNTPYPSTKINNVLYNYDNHYLYECYYNFDIYKI